MKTIAIFALFLLFALTSCIDKRQKFIGKWQEAGKSEVMLLEAREDYFIMSVQDNDDSGVMFLYDKAQDRLHTRMGAVLIISFLEQSGKLQIELIAKDKRETTEYNRVL